MVRRVLAAVAFALASSTPFQELPESPRMARLYYQFSSDDSLVPFEDEKDWGTREKTFTSVPLNPDGIVIGGTRAFSFARLPAAPRHSAYAERADARAGRFEPGGRGAFQIRSQALGEHRVWLYSTPGLEGGGGEPRPVPRRLGRLAGAAVRADARQPLSATTLGPSSSQAFGCWNLRM